MWTFSSLIRKEPPPPPKKNTPINFRISALNVLARLEEIVRISLWYVVAEQALPFGYWRNSAVASIKLRTESGKS